MARDRRSNRLDIMVRAVATAFARDFGSDSLLPNLRGKLKIIQINSDGVQQSIENGLGSFMYVYMFVWFSQISGDLNHRAGPEWYHTIAT